MKVAELDTPALLIDLDIFERNLARVANYAQAHHLRLRPHTKTHKSPEVAERQLALGAAGLTVAKVSEGAALMETLPATDLLIAFPIFGRVVETPGVRFHKMNEEHGFLSTEQAERKIDRGEKLRIIPNHICVAVNLHERVYGIRGEEVERNWKVAGRGKLQ